MWSSLGTPLLLYSWSLSITISFPTLLDPGHLRSANFQWFFLLEFYAIIDTICSTRRSSLDSLCPLSTTTALSATSLAGWHPPNAVNWTWSQKGANLLCQKILRANRLRCPHCLPASLMQRRYSILQQVQQHTKYYILIKPWLTHLPLFLLLLTHSSGAIRPEFSMKPTSPKGSHPTACSQPSYSSLPIFIHRKGGI